MPTIAFPELDAFPALDLYPGNPVSLPELTLPFEILFDDADRHGRVTIGDGDLEPSIDFQLLQGDGTPVPLASADSAIFYLQDRHRDRPVHSGTIVYTNAAAGRGRFVWELGDSDREDFYYAWVRLTFGGRPITVPADRQAFVRIA